MKKEPKIDNYSNQNSKKTSIFKNKGNYFIFY